MTEAGPLRVGDTLADRYVLLAAVATDGPAVLWRAHDDVLARTVAVKVVATPNKSAREAASAFLDAAVRTGSVNHTGLVRVYDAAQQTRPGRGNDVAMVISEWVEGEALDLHLTRVGALAAADATDVLRQLAEALAAAHAGGLLHGRLHPRNVLISPAGRVRLADVMVAAALHGTSDLSVGADTRALGGVLYALLTGRWPVGATGLPAGELTPAPVSEGHPMAARQLRAGVPRALDSVVTRTLDPARLPTAQALTRPLAVADAADAAVAELRVAAVAAPAAPKPPGRIRRAFPWVLALAFVTAVGIAGWVAGLAIGDLPRAKNGVDAIVSTTEAPSPGARPAAAALDLTKVPIRDFDPEGDKQENPDQVRNAVDGIPTTAWATSLYKSAAFGGLKKGVGLLLDLGKPTVLHSVQVGFSAPGANVELRVSTDTPIDAAGMMTVAGGNAGAQVATLTPTPGTTARYILVWITNLPKDGDGYRVGISELRVT